MRAGVASRLRRRDPGLRIGLRALRLSIATLPAFYVFLYGMHNSVAASYVVFGVVAAALFTRLSGPASERARVLLAALPAIWALIAVGTALSVNLWLAIAGTLVIGFVTAFVGVGGPRLAALAGGLQVVYIVSNFPPHRPDALWSRLIGATVGMVLTVLAELVLWPDPAPERYERRLREATDAVADLMGAAADVLAGRTVAAGVLPATGDRAADAADRTRLDGAPRSSRPTSASRHSRALREAAIEIRQLAELMRRYVRQPELGQRYDPELAEVLSGCAAAVRTAGHAVVGDSPPDAVEDVAALGRRLEARPVGTPPDVGELRLRVCLWNVARHVRALTVAIRIVLAVPVGFDVTQPTGTMRAFWFAPRGELSLFWREYRLHLTPRSVYLQGALRLAVALAAARAITGELNLAHGFWVLIGTLTIMRTSAVSTRATLVTATVGTVTGAVIAGLLLRFANGTPAFAVEFGLATVLTFAVAPLLGLLWTQTALTLMVTLVFAQTAPVDWTLAQVRLVDFVVGGTVGIAVGLLIWPRGAGGELRRRLSTFLTMTAAVAEQTVAVVSGREQDPSRPRATLAAARHQLALLRASQCLYHQERASPKMALINWDAGIASGLEILRGAELILRREQPLSLAGWPRAASATTDIVGPLGDGYRIVADQSTTGAISRPLAASPSGAAISECTSTIIATDVDRPRMEVLRFAWVAGWLQNASENLDWFQTASRRPPRSDSPGDNNRKWRRPAPGVRRP